MWLVQGHTLGTEELRLQRTIIKNYKLKTKSYQSLFLHRPQPQQVQTKGGWGLAWEARLTFSFRPLSSPPFRFLLSQLCIDLQSPSGDLGSELCRERNLGHGQKLWVLIARRDCKQHPATLSLSLLSCKMVITSNYRIMVEVESHRKVLKKKTLYM